jgi:hypothetical protein
MTKGRAVVAEADQQRNDAHLVAEVLPQHDPLLANQPMPYRGIFYPLGFGVEIYTNDSQVLEVAMESWGHLRPSQMSATIRLRVGVNDTEATECPPAPTVRAQGHLITFIADAENQATGDLNAGFGFAWVSRATLQHRLYFRYHFLEAIALVLLHAHHAPALHAACVARHGRGMLLCGDSGAGKSTLAYACARAGFTYISDDASYLLRDADQLQVIGHPHKFRFRPSCTELFPELKGRALTPRLEGKPSIEVPSAELPGIITSQSAIIQYIILLKRSPNAAARLTPVATQIALEHLERGLYPVEEIRSKQRATLHRLASVPAFEFHYSDLHEAIESLNTLASGAESGI